MSKKIKIVLISIVAVSALAAAGVWTMLAGRVKMNPAGTVGNTAGNLNNSGLFCEYGDKVYFSNSFDGGSLFVMNPDETELKRLKTMKVRNILAGGSYLYFFQTGSSSSESGPAQIQGIRSFDRCGLDGSGSASLTRDVVTSGQLVDNYLYLLTAPSSGPLFYKIKIDKTDKTTLAEYSLNPACAENGVIYYNNTQSDHYLYALDTKTDTASEIWRGNLWYPVKQGDYIYYMDVANDYRLCRYSLSQNVIEVLTHDRVDCFNVNGSYIYYQKNGQKDGSGAQLKWMFTDGSNETVLAEGNYTNINMTSRYVYFQAFGDETTMYHSSLGSNYYDRFQAAEGF
ncbi:MAG: DUF5050 domain-containing protein [Lachnospiraceae bacterium]|nr:DUF5050 domain-containing protein [Lachnospiraceae bacterium]